MEYPLEGLIIHHFCRALWVTVKERGEGSIFPLLSPGLMEQHSLIGLPSISAGAVRAPPYLNHVHRAPARQLWGTVQMQSDFSRTTVL